MKLAQYAILAISLFLCAIIALTQPAVATILAVASFGVWVKPEARLGTATLLLSILSQKVMEAFKTKVPALSFFSQDLGLDSNSPTGLAAPIKFGQEVVSHLALVPAVSDHTPGEDLESGALNPKDYITDIYMKIDRAKKVVLTVPTADAVRYVLDGAIDSTVMEAGKALARAVLADVLSFVTPANFSQSMVETTASADFDTLRTSRVALNLLGTLEPRYGLGGSVFLSNISDDPQVASGDYKGQMLGADPYLSLVNIEGYTEVKEFPNFPANASSTIGTFTANATTNVITTAAAHSLAVGDRVRASSTTTLPAGMSPATTYYVLTVPSATTITISASNGGSVLDITDTGTGTHTLSNYGTLNAFFFEKRAIHFASRQLTDNFAIAEKLGIPKTIAVHTETDPDTGLTFTSFAWMKPNTQDIFIAFTVAYGVKAGRGLAASTGTDPRTLAVGAGMDFGGIRVLEN